MKTTPVSLLLAGLATLASGCQPEVSSAGSPAGLVSQEAALSVGTWTNNAPSLLAHASGHTATLLSGPGDVLVTHGGEAEIYNPYTNTWRRTGSLLSASRARSAATALPSGKVLVTGGFTPSGGNYLSTFAEVYDPATETWSPTGPMVGDHADHTNVVLDSGKVLLVGGELRMGRGGPVGPSTELYAPDTNTWSTPGGSFMTRSFVSATVLYSGQVLATGGSLWLTDSGRSSAEANLYDPATNSWSFAGLLTQARKGHASVRLYSGRVLIVGGTDGGDTAELFNPYSGFSLAAPVPFTPGNSVTATMLYSGEVLVTDGAGQAALYDEGSNTWRSASNLNVARGAPKATLLHTGEVLFVGGASANPNAVERFTR